jgi:hypothetical protein
MGYQRIQTYILDAETGVSLRASGWVCEGSAGGGVWKHTDGKTRRTDQPTGLKSRWSLTFANMPPRDIIIDVVDADVTQLKFGGMS